ncbi:hypothetical protein ACJ73_05425 [Blastomyces percursus]|uniref:Uncharacterized protein n=1 Tax=Blastomyces percursus TaxID=1658174 RepID=A0A1J9R3X8_9EURO|nr:hypothetical protein ACJ73_05425 [Blastomyces percursus]
MALTSDRQVRKRASTRAMQENAEPNKRTDRSQNHDDDQATAHDLLEEIRRRSQKRKDMLKNHQAIEIDEDLETETDSVLYMLPHSGLMRKLREKQQKRQTWVNRAIKCCSCEGTGSTVNKCACGHEYCGIFFRYSDEPITTTGEPVREIRDL